MRAYTFRKSSVAIAFCVLMVLMTQTGYLDNLNPWSGNQETLDQITEAMETGGSSSSNSNLTASVEGANLFIDESMSNITFEYDTGQTSTSNLFIVKDISVDGVFNPLTLPPRRMVQNRSTSQTWTVTVTSTSFQHNGGHSTTPLRGTRTTVLPTLRGRQPTYELCRRCV